jgi:hypothetical protein
MIHTTAHGRERGEGEWTDWTSYKESSYHLLQAKHIDRLEDTIV